MDAAARERQQADHDQADADRHRDEGHGSQENMTEERDREGHRGEDPDEPATRPTTPFMNRRADVRPASAWGARQAGIIPSEHGLMIAKRPALKAGPSETSGMSRGHGWDGAITRQAMIRSALSSR